ncbi:MAG: hypothetical protein CEE42_13890 [Promethearchaeota archaeon Loki_b31]|nr:MAG: hypothetical protein CEE42_13890 [Candidatus Lokiarchaeota archaeon Loki_b31]
MTEELSDELFWKQKIKKHLTTFIVIIIAGICIVTGAILVLFWFIQTSPIGLQGTATFNQWSLDWIVGFYILVILWELLFVGIPTGLFFGVGGYIWWNRLPDEEKQEFKARDKKKTHTKRNAGGGGGFSFFMFIAYCIYMGIQGNYYAEFGSQPYSYWVYSWFLTIMWILIVFGVPICIILLIVYLTVWRKKSE